MRHTFTILLTLLAVFGYSQKAVIIGTVTDLDTKLPIDYASVYIDGSTNAVETKTDGTYRIEVEDGQNITLIVSRIGYIDATKDIDNVRGIRYINFKLAGETSDYNIVVRDSKIEDVGMVREEVHELKLLPSASGNLESVLPSIALGTNSGSGGELSSQYNVRGGNYDENLVYVNDFEIFRPQLVRAGQQEGLSFPNIDMIQSLSFSSGGFEAKYGDKLSSVLDIKYKRPDEFKASVGLGVLGTSAHIEGSKRLGPNVYNKLRYVLGGRYKTTKLLLGSQDTKGEYLPSFSDFQGYLTYDISKTTQIGLLGNYNTSVFEFTPKSGETTTGGFNQVKRLFTQYEGGERDRFINGLVGTSVTYVPNNDETPMYFKLLGSVFSGIEQENFDIIGAYRLSEIETSFGADDDEFGQETRVLGAGTLHEYVRNELYNRIYNVDHRGGIEIPISDDENGFSSNFIEYSVKYQHEYFDDNINEWERLDSAGYNFPVDTESLKLNYSINSENTIRANKTSAFIQNAYTKKVNDKYEFKAVGGVRISYRDLNNETLVSPRVQLYYKPLGGDRDIAFKLAGGVYYQQPFYREMRRPDGTMNLNLKSQKSYHLVTGLSYDFDWNTLSDKPFRLIAEAYYKKMDNLVSYDIDNVRVQYSGENDSKGYAYGLDMRINGEFVPGAESWVNLSFLKTRESLNGIQHLKIDQNEATIVPVKDVPRPTDRLFAMSMFFQDYLPMNENFKMHLNFSIGTGLPYGQKNNNIELRNYARYKPYHRIDIGFGYQLWNQDWLHDKPYHPLRFAKNAWISLEVFNLMKVSNVASVNWIKDIQNTYHPIPNNLTSRRINLRMKFDF